MSWIHSSKGIACLTVLALLVTTAGVAAGVSVEPDVQEEAEVGTEITVSATVTDLYDESDSWTLTGTTELEDVTGWQVTKVTPSGEETTSTYEGSTTFEEEIASDENLDHVEVSITGTVPAVENYSYQPRQTFQAGHFAQVIGNNVNEIQTVEVHHYTTDSKEARTAIKDASDVVEQSDDEDAQSNLDSAIGVYEDGSFDNAKGLADDAKESAEESQQSQQTMQLVLYAVGALVIIGLIGGGIWYWQSQREEYDKLR